jgi:hypothetical protein
MLSNQSDEVKMLDNDEDLSVVKLVDHTVELMYSSI